MGCIIPDRVLYLAVNTRIAKEIFAVEIGQLLLDTDAVKVLVFDVEEEVITQWLPH